VETVAAWLLLGLPVGFAAGFAGTLLGIGGGAVMVPSLVLLGVPVSTAAPASLVAILGTSAGGLRRLARRGLVDWRLALFLETASGLGAALGVYLHGFLPEDVLRRLLSLVLLLSAAGLLLEERLRSARPSGRRSPVRLVAAWLVSLIAGVLSALLGIGGGVLKVPALVFAMGLPLRVALATSKLMVGVTASVGVVGYALEGRIYWPLALSLLAGTYMGATVSAKILIEARERLLRIAASSYYVLTAFMLARK